MILLRLKPQQETQRSTVSGVRTQEVDGPQESGLRSRRTQEGEGLGSRRIRESKNSGGRRSWESEDSRIRD